MVEKWDPVLGPQDPPGLRDPRNPGTPSTLGSNGPPGPLGPLDPRTLLMTVT